MAETEADVELKALSTVLGALTPLEPDARSRVLDYVLRRFGVPGADAAPSPITGPSPGPSAPQAHAPGAAVTDIRSLTEQKKPKSAIEMAALVAYYLNHVAPEAERRPQITAKDIGRYFPQANFPLPEKAPMTLVHAKNAGYFDAGSSRGSYKLNPVGYNLVAHRLPAGATAPSKTPRRRSRRPQGSAGHRQPSLRKRRGRKAR